jgi:hypothetical protein
MEFPPGLKAGSFRIFFGAAEQIAEELEKRIHHRLKPGSG